MRWNIFPSIGAGSAPSQHVRSTALPYNGHMYSLLMIALISAVLSFLARSAVEHFLLSRTDIFPPWIALDLTENAGVAFGITFAPFLQSFLILLAMIILLFLAYHTTSATQKVGLGIILGGAIANILDRLPDGRVTDFIAVWHFPVFNIADSFITIGVALLLWEHFLHSQPSS